MSYQYVQRVKPMNKRELKDRLLDLFDSPINFRIIGNFRNGRISNTRLYSDLLYTGNYAFCPCCVYLVKVNLIEKKVCPICGTYYRFSIRNKGRRKLLKTVSFEEVKLDE